MAHALVWALLLALPRQPEARPGVILVDATELSIEAPRRIEPPPTPRPPAVSAPVAPAVPAPRAPRALARALTPPPPPRVEAATPPPPALPPALPPPSTPPPALSRPPPPVLRATDLLRASGSTMTFPMATAPDVPSNERAVLFPGTTGTELERARSASQGYVRELLAESTAREAPGVRAYLWNVRRRVSEVWRPGVVRVPNLAETLLAGFIAPERAMRILGQSVMRRQRQLLAEPPQRLGGAVDAIEAIGGASGNIAGNGPSMRQSTPTDTGEESWRRNVRTTRAEVQVDQDPNGRVLEARLVRSSGMAAFDRAALQAVREGVDAQDPIPLPGGRTSRWSFTVVASRRLFAPSIGGTFDESRGWFSVQLPGQVSLRSRVRMESSAPLETPTP